MKAIVFILLAFGPFLIFAVRGLLQRNKAEEITLKGVQVFFHWFISLILLTTLVKVLGLSLTLSVVLVVLHHLVWVLVAYYGEERSWRFIKRLLKGRFRKDKTAPNES